jgi:hypothetical protein
MVFILERIKAIKILTLHDLEKYKEVAFSKVISSVIKDKSIKIVLKLANIDLFNHYDNIRSSLIKMGLKNVEIGTSKSLSQSFNYQKL